MAKNAVQNGVILTAIALTGGVVAGTPALIGALLVVPLTDALEGEEFEAATTGVWEFPKTAANTPAQFANAYWSVANGEMTTTATANKLAGCFTSAYINGDLVCNVRLNGVSVI